MPGFEVSRTLVKSPPEVWAELERSERLAELLGDDAITITRTEPETKIEWQGSAASGTIEIGASGWGTKVRLTAQAADPPEMPQAETEVAEETVAVVDNESSPVELEIAEQHAAELADQDEPELAVADEPELAAPDEPVTETKISFWRRIKTAFSSKPPAAETAPVPDAIAESAPASERRPDAITEAAPDMEPEPEPESESKADFQPDTAHTDAGVDADDGSGGPVDYESLLTAVLDHLGSAHKRPFTAT